MYLVLCWEIEIGRIERFCKSFLKVGCHIPPLLPHRDDPLRIPFVYSGRDEDAVLPASPNV